MPRDISKLKAYVEGAKKRGVELNKEKLEEMGYITPIYSKYEDKEGKPKRGRPKKEYKEEEIMKGKSELKITKSGKPAVETDLEIKKGLEPKVKRALKKSIIHQAETQIKGGKLKKIDLDISSDSEEEIKPKRRGRPKKGCGYDSSSDEEDIREYGDILKHLVKHIRDPKEKIDPEDYKQAIELIKKIKYKKREKL